ncbi:MerR family transcriptional regulator [Micromonospora sp. NPDC005806]|uniref:MerR family transcriptional regulator n=1 Tax=Micromonospora sp. NPDC005806 TaxID=3364234 RepID=UPI0036CD60E2
MITIGQLAAYAGVTIKAVRHYHARGLLPEPERDASGYRRYTPEHAVQLVQIRTLAEAGVPLARVRELLAADPAAFAAAVTEIDRALRERIQDLRRARERVAGLRTGERLFVSAEVADYLERLRGLGISERFIRTERDLWILLQSAFPAQAAAWIADKHQAIEDPEFQAVYLAYDAAFDWPPDDPRLPALAARVARWAAGRAPSPAPDPRAARLAATHPGASSPAWDRIGALIRQRAQADLSPAVPAASPPTRGG